MVKWLADTWKNESVRGVVYLLGLLLGIVLLFAGFDSASTSLSHRGQLNPYGFLENLSGTIGGVLFITCGLLWMKWLRSHFRK